MRSFAEQKDVVVRGTPSYLPFVNEALKTNKLYIIF